MSYKEDNWGKQVSSVWGLKEKVSWNGAAVQRGIERGAEESLLLEAVTKERLVKTQQAAENLGYAVVICKV
jgi:hypothetical protein